MSETTEMTVGPGCVSHRGDPRPRGCRYCRDEAARAANGEVARRTSRMPRSSTSCLAKPED